MNLPLDKDTNSNSPEIDGDTGGECTENDVRAEEDKEDKERIPRMSEHVTAE